MKKRRTGLWAVLLLLAVAAALIPGLSGGLVAELAAENAALADAGLSGEALQQGTARNTGLHLGLLSLLPPFVAIALALITKEVITALLIGVLTGHAMRVLLSGGSGFLAGAYRTFSDAVDGVIAVAADRRNCAVVLLCLMIGGLVALIRASGGFSALAARLVRRIKSPRRAQLAAQFLGLLIFFDDYANALVVGPVMSPVTDRLGVSREKLAYIVDSTAAPVAGIAVISSWISAELAAIESGFDIAGVQGSAYVTFLGSIPYCFYNLFALLLLLFGILSRREFGPMLHAEARARRGEPVPGSAAPEADGGQQARGSILSAVVPIVLLCSVALVEFYFDGRTAALATGLLPAELPPFSLRAISIAFGAADTITILIRAALLSSAVALALGLATRSFSFQEGVEAWLSGASGLLVTGVILCLAWALSDVVSTLGTAYYLVELVTAGLPYWCVPMLIFLACCAISFATGSYGCMLIVMPMAVPVAYGTIGTAGTAIADPQAFLCACVAGVLSGAIFGDHCSPISDTTILSSIGTGCNNLDHARTQLPYALAAAGIAAVCGALPAGFGLSPWIGLPFGALACAGVLFIFGKNPDKLNG